jgi:hypothetical protein
MASLSGNNKIVLKCGEVAQLEEGFLSGTVSPGMNLVLCEETEAYGRHTYAAGSSDYVGTGTGISTTVAALKIAVENALLGVTIDDAYTSGADVAFHVPKKGDVVQVLVASGLTVTKACGLAAGSDGKFVVDAANPALESMEASFAALAADTHVRARVL